MTLFFILTFLLLFGFGIVFASVDRQDVIANWDSKRCDIPVMIGGALYKPSTDSRSALEFSADNFQFCMNKIVQEVFTTAVTPFLSLFKQQIDAANVVKDVQNSIQEMLGNFFRGFSSLLDTVFQRFMAVGFEFRRIFGEAQQAMQRAFGIAITTVYLGITSIVGIDNSIKVVANVILIIMGILAGLMILLFFILLPVLPIIMTTISVLVAGGVGAAAGYSGAFCFAAHTKIDTQTRGPIRIEHIQLGDVLSDGGVVEGILKVNGTEVQMYTLGDILVSGEHLVFYDNQWILVKEHPQASPALKREPFIYCLNTSTRNIPIREYLFRDWEELTPEYQTEWNQLVASMLGSTASTDTDEYALLSGAWFVKTASGLTNIRDIQLGDKILDSHHKPTKVLGIYEGFETPNDVSPFWITDSVWRLKEGMYRQEKTQTEKPAYKKHGFHLVTDSGTFILYSPTQALPVRDFTEVGIRRLSETYEWMKQRL